MPDATLESTLAAERATAVRTLLRQPFLDAAAAPDGFRLAVRHRGWLEAWFETTCGWPLNVDAAAGFARLRKRAADPDERRALLRTRGSGEPFDRRRYELLCLAAAELVRHPTTTVGLLASAVAAEAGLDTSRHGERAAFVDALRALVAWGALHASSGDLDGFVDDEHQNALLTGDTARLHHLLACATPPSTLAADNVGTGVDAAIVALASEPRYGGAPSSPGDAEDEQRLRWLRHSLARRLLDDPALYVDDLSPAVADYLANPAGRRWLRERAAEAGLELEERAEGIVAVDPDAIATDRQFPAPQGNAHQLALLLVDGLLTAEDADGARRPRSRSPRELRAAIEAVLERFPGWARAHRVDDGPDRLLAEAVDLLVDLDLARRDAHGYITARPALARYRAGEPVRRGTTEPRLLEELS
jgi:uncharacterized protein (TIGR02678 family)